MLEARVDNGRYDGLKHLEMAGACVLAGDQESAGVLLAGAGYWSHVRYGRRANPALAAAWAEYRRCLGGA